MQGQDDVFMPVAHSHRFIFIHVPKTAGRSVLNAFRNAGISFELDGLNLWNLLEGHYRKADLLRRVRAIYPVNSLANFPQGHLPATVLRELLPIEIWKSYFKFAFVRNPWDLVLSTYQFLRTHIGDNEHISALEPDMTQLMQRCNFERYVRLYPMIRSDMSALFTDDDGRDMVDFVGRFECIADDFQSVCRKVGVTVPLPHDNRSEHAHYRGYYTEETKAIVAQHFARDIARFGYAF
ncbi:MAG: sulfotransferase family 2 domain-containing protein [Acidobacteriaceae bacterium]|nr:sulfotransferase family 2 domain-containing protein [Acidobacteriaceae bacterium]